MQIEYYKFCLTDSLPVETERHTSKKKKKIKYNNFFPE